MSELRSEANIQTRSQGPPEPQLLLDKIDSEAHIAKLREIVEKSKADRAMPRSPLYFQSAKGFLHETTNQPLYSVAAFAASVMNCSLRSTLTHPASPVLAMWSQQQLKLSSRGYFPSVVVSPGLRPNSTRNRP
jgi:hypothetical protein